MDTITFLPLDTVTVDICDLTPLALAWAFGQAVGEPMSVEIAEDSAWAHISTDRMCDCNGEPRSWIPLSDWDQTGPHIYRLKVSTWTADGITWHARDFVVVTVVFDDENPLRAACLTIVHGHSGRTVSVPRQLQHLEQLRTELNAQMQQRMIDADHDAREESLYAMAGIRP